MKVKLSFNKLLRNDKLMILCSAILAVVIWALVVYGPSVTEEKTITVPISVVLNTPSGDASTSQYLQVLSKSADTVEVVVSGNRSVLGRLKAEDIVVSADLSGQSKPVEDFSVRLDRRKSPSSEVSEGDYEILSLSLSEIKVTTDLMGKSTYKLDVNTDAIELVNDNYRKEKPTVDIQLGEGETVTVFGPKRVRDSISTIRTTFDETSAIKATTVFQAKLVAFSEPEGKDKTEKQIDMSLCKFLDPDGNTISNTVNVTVPVNFKYQVTLGVKPTNLPKSLQDRSGFITLEPETLLLVGPEEDVKSVAKELQELPLNFDNIPRINKSVDIPLSIPEHITEANGIKSVSAIIDTASLEQKELMLPLYKENSNLLASNVEYEAYKANTPFMLKNLKVTVVGDKASLDLLKPANLTIKITTDKDNNKIARVELPTYCRGWVYYGDEKNGYDVY